MSYDILFLAKTPDETWQNAMEEIESRPYRVDPEAWRRIVTSAREILGEIDVDADEGEYWLIDEASGIGVHVSEYETSATVPYLYSGAEARNVLERLYRLSTVIESATGLAGYDAQVELPLADAAGQIDLGVASFDEVAVKFDLGQ